MPGRIDIVCTVELRTKVGVASLSSPYVARLKRANATLVRAWLRQRVKTAAARMGFLVTRLDEDARRYVTVSHNDEVPLPVGAEETLRSDNPDLVALEEAYDAFESPAVGHTQWRKSFLEKNLKIAWFRGDNAYVWQLRLLRTSARAKMYLQVLDVESRDRLRLLDTMHDDGLFGAWTFAFQDRRPVSRDLLDSVTEINYLDARMGLAGIMGFRVLDIGAGYGRLAHRMSEALPNLTQYDCIDGVAVSTFLCDYYTRFRGLDKVRVVPLTEHETLLDSYDLCVNIHSWSECSQDSIRWWLDRVAERRIPWLLVVPNTPELLSTELDGSMKPFLNDVLDRGYELVDDRCIVENVEIRELIDLRDKFYLFKRAADGPVG